MNIETVVDKTDNLNKTQEGAPQKEIRLVDVAISDENTALNVMVGFLHIAHKRGIFTIDESAKIWECISKFKQP
jgi:glutathione synthase/RimK-type ligase-like ATP-grasp enzyme